MFAHVGSTITVQYRTVCAITDTSLLFSIVQLFHQQDIVDKNQ